MAVPGNPLEDISRMEDVRFVMLGGEVVKAPWDTGLGIMDLSQIRPAGRF